MIKDMQQVQTELEEKFISDQTQITQEALGLKNKKRQRYLTNYSVNQGLLAHKRWTELAEHLITKYNDGYIKNEKGSPQEAGYPDGYKWKIIKLCPGKFEIPDWNKVGRIKDMPF